MRPRSFLPLETTNFLRVLNYDRIAGNFNLSATIKEPEMIWVQESTCNRCEFRVVLSQFVSGAIEEMNVGVGDNIKSLKVHHVSASDLIETTFHESDGCKARDVLETLS